MRMARHLHLLGDNPPPLYALPAAPRHCWLNAGAAFRWLGT